MRVVKTKIRQNSQKRSIVVGMNEKKKSYSTTTTTTKNLKFSYSQTICYYCDGKDE